MALPPRRSHRIPPDDAAAMTRRHRDHTIRGGFFFREELDQMLAQPGCAGIRIYFGRDATGRDNLVVTGVDADGRDMTDGVLMELIIPCPPFCDAGSALIS